MYGNKYGNVGAKDRAIGGSFGSSSREQWEDLLRKISFFRKAEAIATGKMQAENKDTWVKLYNEMRQDEPFMKNVKQLEGTEIPFSGWGKTLMLPPAWS
jgi:hypothetical protein